MDLELIDHFATEFFKYLETNRKNINKIIIVSHDNSDVDAVASVIGLYYLFQIHLDFPEDSIIPYLPQMDKSADYVINRLSLWETLPNQFRVSEEDWDGSVLILVDNHNFERICGLEPPTELLHSIIIIDHHDKEPDEKITNLNEECMLLHEKIALSCIISHASSTAEIITTIWANWTNFEPKAQISPRMEQRCIAQLLLNGIMADSARLRYSSNSIIPALFWLVESGADISKIDFAPREKLERQVKIARIKGASRLEKPHYIGDRIVLFTRVNAYESSVCRGLLALGADIAFCLSSKKDKDWRLIGKTSDDFQKETNFSLGFFMENLKNDFKGNGGGHSGAAGFNGKKLPNNIEKKIISRLRNQLEKSER